MFSKKKKQRVQISAPSNFEHRVHTDFDEQEQKFVGLPRQWQSLIEDTAKRPKPFIDATVITTVEPRKVRGREFACVCCFRFGFKLFSFCVTIVKKYQIFWEVVTLVE